MVFWSAEIQKREGAYKVAVTKGNFYLNDAQMTGNAQYILDYLSQRGWTKNAICGMLGNMQTESTINPGIWQSLNAGDYDGGYGLVQWTPATKFTTWASANGYAMDDIDGQLERILWEVANHEQWISTSLYPMSFAEFTQSTDSAYNLAMVFIKNYERPENPNQPIRGTQAQHWFDVLSGDDGSAEIIKIAVEWAVGIAEDDSHGYDWGHRDGPDYDCSSLMSHAYYNAGLNTRPGYTPATGTMYEVFTAAGFNDVTGQVDLKSGSGLLPGDVLLHPGKHTAMYVGDGQLVEASINELGDVYGGQTGDQTGKEIWVHGYYNYPWTYCLRYKSGGSSWTPEPQKLTLLRWISM